MTSQRASSSKESLLVSSACVGRALPQSQRSRTARRRMRVRRAQSNLVTLVDLRIARKVFRNRRGGHIADVEGRESRRVETELAVVRQEDQQTARRQSRERAMDQLHVVPL